MSKPKILAASWHPGGINAIIPVIKKIKQDSLVDVVVMGHDVSIPLLKQENINHQTIQDYSLSDVSIESMQRLLQLTAPDLILTGTSTQDGTSDVIEQTLTLAARDSKTPTLAVLDVWMNYSQRFSDIYTKEKFKFLPDIVAIMDEYAKKEMIKEGFPLNRLRITGNPDFDSLEEKARTFTKRQKEQTLERTGLNKEISVFYAAGVCKEYKQEYGFWDLSNIELIRDSIARLPASYKQKTGLIVKLHPRTPSQDLKEIKENIGEQEAVKLITEIEINAEDLVLAADITTTPNSTLAFKAVYMHRPVISLQPNLRTTDYLAILTKNRLIPAGYDKTVCIDLIQTAIMNKRFREELVQKSSSFRTDGKATQRVTNLVYETLEISPKNQ